MQDWQMTPAPGSRRLGYVGDRIGIRLSLGGGTIPDGCSAYVRTNLGRASKVRQEILETGFGQPSLAGSSWRDIPMQREEQGWSLELPLTEVGFFQAKAYVRDAAGKQHWPEGDNAGWTVHPDASRTRNTIYCCFPRMLGESRFHRNTSDPELDARVFELDRAGYTVIPPSGTFRDTIAALDHIMDDLGCRILHLLPINPPPTTHARFGRFGSPYACQDLLQVDPAMVEFDKKTTGIQQFEELTRAVHARGGQVFLDMVINHTGWNSTLINEHPEWFVKNEEGEFESPGAWGNIWGDLVELDQRYPELWRYLAEVFVVWCRRGVDGFRCDAGYKVPVEAWRFIIATVREEFPNAIFLLEGLGGAWSATEALLLEGGMQWAYSELFQEYSGVQIAGYLDHALKQSHRVGLLVHYSETHDNNRLAAKGKDWSLLRNRLCALTSPGGGFGFTCGVEWLADEKFLVHGSRGLAWGSEDNIVEELGTLNRLLAEHPAFFDGAETTRLSGPDSQVYALRRVSASGEDSVLVLVNTDLDKSHMITLSAEDCDFETKVDLIGMPVPERVDHPDGWLTFEVLPGAVHCLAPTPEPVGLSGNAYREARARAAMLLQALADVLPIEKIGPGDWQALAELLDQDPLPCLDAIHHLESELSAKDLPGALKKAMQTPHYPRTVRWVCSDASRVFCLPPGHGLLVEAEGPARITFRAAGESKDQHRDTILAGGRHLALFQHPAMDGDATLRLELDGDAIQVHEGIIRCLPAEGGWPEDGVLKREELDPANHPLILLTNGRGGMARIPMAPGVVTSKYDCLLGANLHPEVPCDRHIMVKRVRAWINADGFISPMESTSLTRIQVGRVASWRFLVNAGDGQGVAVKMKAVMLEHRNEVVLAFDRDAVKAGEGTELPLTRTTRLILRVDLEDRNFHSQTQYNSGAAAHFEGHSSRLESGVGFRFAPAVDRWLEVEASGGNYTQEVEWCHGVPHPVEQTRGQIGEGDAFSAGWFDLPLLSSEPVLLRIAANEKESTPWEACRKELVSRKSATVPKGTAWEARLRDAARDFMVRRGEGLTVVAGYPWFLDWGRDTLIAARGLLAGGWRDEVREMLRVFARWEEKGTLPNTIHGEDASNRDTSDAPLWLGIVCEEWAAGAPDGHQLFDEEVEDGGRSFADVLASIAEHYLKGTPNGIHVDEESGLVWSPSHFTWMDTNYPAGTPREGYPVEIQVMWIRLLRWLEKRGLSGVRGPWGDWRAKAEASFHKLFWVEKGGYVADLLVGSRGTRAASAVQDNALRSNGLMAVTLGIVEGERARSTVEAARQHLLVPGGLRSLAPLPVSPPLPVRSANGSMLNDPSMPYWGRYEGDEDSRRKPAYHNGTAWTWTFPHFAEALAMAWPSDREAVQAALSYLGSIAAGMREGCLGQIPEVLDGDAPHIARGCDAQAWGVTETLRVQLKLKALISG